MKYIVCFACLFLSPGLSRVYSQDLAYLKVINAIGLDSPTYISINGNQFRKGKPVPAGRASGVLALTPGEYNISVENKGAKKSGQSVPLKLTPHSTTALVFFIETKEVTGEGEDRVFPFLNHIVLRGNDGAGTPRVTLFSFAKQHPLEVRVGTKPYRMVKNRPVKIQVQKREVLKITAGGNEIGSISIDYPIHYVGFIYDVKDEPGYQVTVFEHRNPRSKLADDNELEVVRPEE